MLSTPSCAGVYPKSVTLRGPRARPTAGGPRPHYCGTRRTQQRSIACCPYGPPQHGWHQASSFWGASWARGGVQQPPGSRNQPAPMPAESGAETPLERISTSHGWDGVEQGWNPCPLLPGSWGVDPRLTLPSPPPLWKTTGPGRGPASLVCEGPGNGRRETKRENIPRMQTVPSPAGALTRPPRRTPGSCSRLHGSRCTGRVGGHPHTPDTSCGTPPRPETSGS